MTIRTFLHPGLCVVALAALLLPACQPLPATGPAPEQRITATLLTAGEGVRVNGRPAASGQRIRPGDSLTTGRTSAARIEFSERTTVEIIDATQPVSFEWSHDELVIRLDDATADVDKSESGFSLVRVLSRLAEIFSVSRFVFEERFPEYFRVDLFSGRVEMVRPRPGTIIAPGQYLIAYPNGQVDAGQTSQRRVQELRARFEGWKFVRSQLREVPRLTDRRLAEAVGEIERAGLRLGRVSGPDSGESEVIAQRPRAGERVEPGTRIDLTVRAAEITVRVPDLRERSYAEARKVISESGFRLGAVAGARSGDRYVVSQNPSPRMLVPQGSRVDLVLRSREVTTVRVPDVRERLLRDAIREIEKAGLKPGSISGGTQGDAFYVVSQSPSPGSPVARGAPVNLVVRGVIQ